MKSKSILSLASLSLVAGVSIPTIGFASSTAGISQDDLLATTGINIYATGEGWANPIVQFFSLGHDYSSRWELDLVTTQSVQPFNQWRDLPGFAGYIGDIVYSSEYGSLTDGLKTAIADGAKGGINLISDDSLSEAQALYQDGATLSRDAVNESSQVDPLYKRVLRVLDSNSGWSMTTSGLSSESDSKTTWNILLTGINGIYGAPIGGPTGDIASLGVVNGATFTKISGVQTPPFSSQSLRDVAFNIFLILQNKEPTEPYAAYAEGLIGQYIAHSMLHNSNMNQFSSQQGLPDGPVSIPTYVNDFPKQNLDGLRHNGDLYLPMYVIGLRLHQAGISFEWKGSGNGDILTVIESNGSLVSRQVSNVIYKTKNGVVTSYVPLQQIDMLLSQANVQSILIGSSWFIQNGVQSN